MTKQNDLYGGAVKGNPATDPEFSPVPSDNDETHISDRNPASGVTRRNALRKGAAVFPSVIAGCSTIENTPTSTPTDEGTLSPTPGPSDSPTPTEETQVSFSNPANYDRIKHYLKRQPFVNKKSTRMYKDVTGMLKLAETSEKDIEVRTPSTPLVGEVPGTEVSEDDVRYGSRTSWEDSLIYTRDLFGESHYRIEESLSRRTDLVDREKDFKIFSPEGADFNSYIAFDTENKYELTGGSPDDLESCGLYLQ